MRLAALTILVTGVAAAAQPAQFREHIIEPKIPGGYTVLIVDLNKDGHPDVVGLTSRIAELAWYENPSWERHVLAKELPGLINVAAYDIDGDGIPELAVQGGFSMVAARSEGLVWLLEHQGDPRGPWKTKRIDALTTSHRVVWADIDGDGKKELINAPLIGPKGLAPSYDQDVVPLVYYRTDDWKRRVIDDAIPGLMHGVRAVSWEPGRREQILTATFGGITLYSATGSGDGIRWNKKLLSRGHEEAPPRAGANDARLGRLNRTQMLASIEPWHGNEVVAHMEDAAGQWKRKVLFSGMKEGHEAAIGDFNGDGRDDIVAGDRGKGDVHVFYAADDAGAQWEHQVLDQGGMAASGCAAADLNGDRRIDIICIGGSTGNLKWYENVK